MHQSGTGAKSRRSGRRPATAIGSIFISANYKSIALFRKSWLSVRIPPHAEGRSARSSRHARRGAMAAMEPQRVLTDARTNGSTRTRSRRVLIPRSWYQVHVEARFARMMVANKPGAPGRLRISVKTIAQGMPVDRLCLWYLPPAFFAAGGPWVRPSPGIPCALCIRARDELMADLGRNAPRDCADMSPTRLGCLRP